MSDNGAESELLGKCPGCRIGRLLRSEQKGFLGTVTEKITCDKCGAVFNRAKDKFKLVEAIDKYSQFWRDFREHSLTAKQWKAIADGAPVHYDPKVGGYVPYVPDEYSESKPSPSLATYEPLVAPSLATNENSPSNDLIVKYELYHDESDERSSDTIELSNQIEPETNENLEEICTQDYSLTASGKYFLRITFNEILDTYHLLKCVEAEKDLDPEQLQVLLDAGFLRRKSRSS